MNDLELLKTRRSVRRFTDEIVPKEVIQNMIEISRYAPSWKNFQIVRYNILQNKELIKQIGEVAVNGFSYNTKTLSNAHQVCVLTYKKDISGKHETGEQATDKTDWEVFDAGIAALQFCLAAHTLGVGTVIMGIINEEIIRKTISIPEDEAIGSLIVFGYPKFPNPKAPSRKEVNELVRYL